MDISTPTGKLVANDMMSVAEWERKVIGERKSAAVQAAKRAGRRMGLVSALPEVTGARLLARRATQALVATADTINAEGLTTATGELLTENAVRRSRRRLSAA